MNCSPRMQEMSARVQALGHLWSWGGTLRSVEGPDVVGLMGSAPAAHATAPSPAAHATAPSPATHAIAPAAAGGRDMHHSARPH